MKLVKYKQGDRVGVGLLEADQVRPLDLARGPVRSLADLIDAEQPRSVAESLAAGTTPVAFAEVQLVAPIDQQEVWAAGVTYKRSRTARMEESAAAASCYDRVYVSARPELFMKATPHRVAGPNEPLRIRTDSNWNVPEPELTLVISSTGRLVGYTVGNDMSSRDIEGDNPLYLPQAKVYNQCCGLGPCITLVDAMPPRENIGIELVIRRGGAQAFRGQTDVGQMARSFEDLIGWLTRDNSFPTGVLLLTGTGIVPDSDFTLQPGDVVEITIDGIGTLSNPIVQG